MKRLLIVVLVSILIFNSCKKDSSNPVNSDAAPPAPALLLPADTATGVAVPTTFSWNAIANADSFTLQVSLSSSLNNPLFNKSGLTVPSQEVTGLSNLTVYYWRVRAINKYGTSDWSSTRSFTTTGPLPNIPTLLSPSNNSTLQSIFAPTLSWSAITGATSYTLQLSDNSSFTSFVYNQNGLLGLSQQVNWLKNATKYYWRVSSSNKYGMSGWSNTFNFTTILDPTPVAPKLLLPTNNANVIIPLTLRWASGKAGLDSSYTLQVSTNNSFTSFVYNQSGLTNTSQQVSGLNNLTVYYWRVNATNSYGTSEWSSFWNFTTASYTSVCSTSSITYLGKTYHTVSIGGQCWLKENLDVGARINASLDQTNNNIIEKYCYHDSDANCTTYGGLYQWAEAVQYKNGATNTSSPNPAFTGNVQGICPSGWHIPTIDEFTSLSTTVGNDGNTLKREDQGTGSGLGTNTSGFSALLSGIRLTSKTFDNLGNQTYFWSSSEYNTTATYGMFLYNSGYTIDLKDGFYKEFGFSIRCLKD